MVSMAKGRSRNGGASRRAFDTGNLRWPYEYGALVQQIRQRSRRASQKDTCEVRSQRSQGCVSLPPSPRFDATSRRDREGGSRTIEQLVVFAARAPQD